MCIRDSFNYDRNETLKVVIGSQSVKIIVDSSNSSSVKQSLGKDGLLKEYKRVSEISMLFDQKAKDEKGIVSFVSTELLMAGLNIRELMTCTPELIIYVDEEQSLKAFEVLKGIKKRCF